jgi:hypothetical protein
MKYYLIFICILNSIQSNAQEERIVKTQTININSVENPGSAGISSRKFTISGNTLLTNLEIFIPGRTGVWRKEQSAVINENNSFVVYTKDRINELLESQKKYIGEQTDSLKILLKLLVDSLPKQTFVITVQEQIQESTLDKLRKEDIAPQNQEIALLKDEIALLKKEIEELKKKLRN